jgi:hypothetical protein
MNVGNQRFLNIDQSLLSLMNPSASLSCPACFAKSTKQLLNIEERDLALQMSFQYGDQL